MHTVPPPIPSPRPRFDSEAIAAATGGTVIRPGPSGPIMANSQTLPAGEWFVALAGEGFDDNRFVPEAARRGVAGVVVSRLPEGVDVPVVWVSDTWQALRDLGRVARRRFVGPVVALTGSSGKTTTRTLVALALSPLGDVHQTAENTNHEPGVPLTLLECPEHAHAQVIELGAHLPGGIERLARTVEPDVRLLLDIGPAHLATLGDLDGVAREKGAIFATARPGDTCVVNLDDPRVAALPVPAGARRVTFGHDGDVALVDAVLDPVALATTARWRTPTGEVSARLPSPARFVADDAAAALAVAWICGVELSAAAAAMERYVPLGGRLRVRTVAPGVTVLDDTYNANPRSLAAALRLLASLPGRRAAVIGDMLELGPDEARFHEEIVALAVALDLELLVLVGPRMAAARQIAPNVRVFDAPGEAVALLRSWVGPGDHVLVKGSRGVRMERVLEGW